MDGFSAEEAAIVALVREFTDREVRPAARDLEHANTYPEELIGQMKEMGIFGLAIPEPWGATQVSAECYAAVTEELARGWMSLADAAALDDSLRYAQQRESFGQPIWQHQSVGNYLADMATKLEAARQLVRYAARRYDSGERSDMEAGMAKLFASETAMEIALNAIRIHGGYGYSTEFDVERYFRDAPLMIVGRAPTRSSAP
jgi:alkylation response protein AidB-like acyl-CoA dehydrogenase